MAVRQASTTNVERAFRPSIVIFTDPGVEDIYTSLKSIILSLGLVEPLRKCIAMMRTQRTPNTQVAQSWFASDIFTPPKAPLDDPYQATSSPFAITLELLRQEVLASHNQQRIEESGYYIPDKPLQVYVIGDPATDATSRILQTLHAQLPEADICCIVCPSQPTRSSSLILPSTHEDRPSAIAVASSQAEQRALANFSYVYEHRQTKSTIMRRELYSYAVAQALYTLLTTSITAHDEFDQAIHANPLSTGTLSTCLITSPYTEAQNFCDVYLASELVAAWQEKNGLFTTYNNPLLASSLAQTTFNENATTEQSTGTDVPAQSNSHNTREPVIQQIYNWPAVTDKPTFHLIKSNEINKSYKKAHKVFITQEWVKYLFEEGEHHYQAWEKPSKDEWKKRSDELSQLLSKRIEELWLHSNNLSDTDSGPRAVKVLLDTVHVSLEQHTHPEQQVNDFNRVGSPPILSDDAQELPVAEEQVTAKQDDIFRLGFTEVYHKQLLSIGKRFPFPESSYIETFDTQEQLVSYKEVLKESLTEKLSGQQAAAPALSTRIAATAVMVTALLLMLSTLFPQFLPGLVLCAILVAYIANLLYAWYTRRKIAVIQNGLLELCNCSYHYQLEQFEQEQRQQGLAALRTEVEGLLKRYSRIRDWTAQLKQNLQDEAQLLKADFFARPIVSHDVYLSNGNLLQQKRLPSDSGYTHSLEMFAGSLLIQTDISTRNRWNGYLYKWMKDATLPFSTKETKEAQDEAKAITHAITQRASAKSTIGLDNLKEKENTDIWKFLCEHRLKPLMNLAQVNLIPSYIFLCGDEVYLDIGKQRMQEVFRGIPVIVLDTKHDERILVAAFYGSNVLPDIAHEAPFPSL